MEDLFVFFSDNGILRQCFNISITVDNETESNEQFLVQLTESAFLQLPENVMFGFNTTTVTIIGGEGN